MSIDRTLAPPLCLALLAACHGGGPGGSAGFGVSAGGGSGAPPAASGGTLDGVGTDGASGGPADLTTGPDAPTTDGDVDIDARETTGGPPPPACGDGRLDPGEQCDDGADNGPSANCYPDCTRNECGDGNLGPLEECDLGAMNGPDDGCSATCAVLPSACAHQTAQAVLIKRPVDIVFIVDNSGSMSEELEGVQKNINDSFAEIIEDSGLDYRVIMLSRFGKPASTAICIEAPLGGIPPGGCFAPPPAPVNNPGKFYHYSVEIQSTDSWCRILSTLHGDEVDLFKTAPDGWVTWLRAGSFKVFVELTDDRAVCDFAGAHYDDHNTIIGGGAAALAFDAALRAADPLHFGAAEDPRNYRFYSINGLGYNDPPESPYTPSDAVVATKCPSGVNSGTGYQSLSVLTGALRFPLCDTASYDVVFESIADGVIADAKISCEFQIPPPPEGKLVDEASIEVSILPLGGIDPLVLGQVSDPILCDAKSFFVLGDTVFLCPEACAAAQDNPTGEITVEFNCEPIQPK